MGRHPQVRRGRHGSFSTVTKRSSPPASGARPVHARAPPRRDARASSMAGQSDECCAAFAVLPLPLLPLLHRTLIHCERNGTQRHARQQRCARASSPAPPLVSLEGPRTRRSPRQLRRRRAWAPLLPCRASTGVEWIGRAANCPAAEEGMLLAVPPAALGANDGVPPRGPRCERRWCGTEAGG
jgi:hypothetical protein